MRHNSNSPMTKNTQWLLEDPVFKNIWEQIQPYTMTSVERGYALYTSVRYIVEKNIKGNIVESGVWRGGSSMLIALTLLEFDTSDRNLFLFDTFSGMPEPEHIDVDLHGNSAKEQLVRHSDSLKESNIWAYAEIENVKINMALTGYPAEKIHYIQGDVTTTAPQAITNSLALLRLDTDWYASTKSEMQNFWPRLNRNGVLLIDDYGHWLGAKKAVDEFFTTKEAAGSQPVYLHTIDYTGRLVVKNEAPEEVEWNLRYDHYPESLQCPNLFQYFPHLKNTDTATCRDKRLRREVPHIWRTDTREKPNKTGNVSTEEAALLYAIARLKNGHRGIEIGSHFGWSTAHLLQGGLNLDAIDPVFSRSERYQQVCTSLQHWLDAGVLRLWPGYSPQIIPAVHSTQREPYHVAFIDGNHDNNAPLLDAQSIIPFLADDGFIVFHDLTFADVEAAVRYLKGQGWQIRVYNTMQVMAVAWRKGEEPPRYAGDLSHSVALPIHLRDLNTTC